MHSIKLCKGLGQVETGLTQPCQTSLKNNLDWIMYDVRFLNAQYICMSPHSFIIIILCCLQVHREPHPLLYATLLRAGLHTTMTPEVLPLCGNSVAEIYKTHASVNRACMEPLPPFKKYILVPINLQMATPTNS